MARLATTFRIAAIIGVLVHAVVIVWHASAMLRGAQQQAFFADAIHSICINGSKSRSDLPQTPGDDGAPDCPICKGMVGAAAVLPSQWFVVRRADVETERLTAKAVLIAARRAPVCPPARGPPRTIET